jgi:hypothetical protein
MTTDAKANFYRAVGLSGALQDMEKQFYTGDVVKVPYILAQSAVPVCLAPNGTVATNGTVTLGTALPTTYSGGIWLRLPAGAVSGGSAGLYYTVMSSTTVGQVYTEFVDPANPFTPYIPSTLVAATGSNVAYTQTTATEITLVNVTLPGGAMGANGSVRSDIYIEYNNSAGNKTFLAKLGAFTYQSVINTTTTFLAMMRLVWNRGDVARQVSHTSPPLGTTSGVVAATGTVNTAVDQTMIISANLATATDFAMVAGFVFTVNPS